MSEIVHVRGGLLVALCFRAMGGVLPKDAARATCETCRRIVQKIRPEFLEGTANEPNAKV